MTEKYRRKVESRPKNGLPKKPKQVARLSAIRPTGKKSNKLSPTNKKHFYNLYQLGPLGYQSLDKDGYIIEVNEKWLKTMGYAYDEVRGRYFGDFITPEYIIY